MREILAEAILSLRPKSKFYIEGDSLANLVWVDTTQTRPSDKEIEEEVSRQAEQKQKTQYIDMRKNEYPSIGDQLDALFKAGAFPEEMAAKIQAVKDKYPK